MAILTLAQYAAALKQKVYIQKTSAVTNSNWQSAWPEGALPAAGAISIGNTANGLVPTNTTTGAANITNFNGTGYLTWAEVGSVQNSVNSFKYMVYDRLFHCGSYGSASGLTTLTAQPSFAARVPNNDYTGLQLWAETSGAVTGPMSITITYTDQSGNAGHSTGAYTTLNNPNASAVLGQIQLASGDSGIQKIESVNVTGGTAQSVNFFIARPLLMGIMLYPNRNVTYPMELTGFLQIFPTSCLAFMHSGNNGTLYDVTLEIASN